MFPLPSGLSETWEFERDEERLTALVSEMPLPSEDQHLVPLVAGLAARSALLRTESRGAHYRSDYPDTADSWRGHILWQRQRGASFEEIF